MRVERSASYSSNQFTLDDLREIVKENEGVPGDTDVDLRTYKADPPYASDTYYIDIG